MTFQTTLTSEEKLLKEMRKYFWQKEHHCPIIRDWKEFDAVGQQREVS